MLDELTVNAALAVTRIIELTGVAIIAAGALGTLLWAIYRVASGVSATEAVVALRSNLGRVILLGLEFLVAADIINTVAVEPTLASVAALAGIVAIRTFLSFSLEAEIEGRWPWQRGRQRPER